MLAGDFHTPAGVDPPMVRYEVGQPMGFYSSWAAFSLSHHALMHLAIMTSAKRADHNVRQLPFSRYAIVGDDVLIKGRTVGPHYLE